MAPAAERMTASRHCDTSDMTTSVADQLNLYGDITRAKKDYISDDQIPSLSDLKKIIPPHCFRPSLTRSIYYALRDLLILSLLYYGAYLTYDTSLHYVYLPVFWFFTGFFMWALFVVAHDCGHGSFSRYKSVNALFGHFLNALILVPFHPWRISHRKHHKNTGNFEKDEIFYPMSETEYSRIHSFARFVYRELYFLVGFAYPIYLIKGYGHPAENISHFSLKSELFTKEERPMVATSLIWMSVMATFLTTCALRFGLNKVIIYYFVPYFIYCFWLTMVTFLHHTEPGSKWYNTKTWSYVRGNLESVDRVYGIFEHFHHDIGTHVIHHLFPAIPHYHLREANAALKPFLGSLQKTESQSPLNQLLPSVHAWQANHVIPDKTDVFVLPKA